MGKLDPRERPWRIAHRGYSERYPENTRLAFDAALDHAVHGIELDLQMTRDRVPVVYHDRTLELVGGGTAAIHDRKLDELARMDFGAWFGSEFRGQALLTLDALMTRYGNNADLLLEIKVRDPDRSRRKELVAGVASQVRDRGLTGSAYLLCYQLPLLEFAHRKVPELKLVLNQDHPRYLPDAPFLWGYSANIRNLNPAFVARARAARKYVLTFTCRTEEELRHARACGVDGIMADDPSWLRESLDRGSMAEPSQNRETESRP